MNATMDIGESSDNGNIIYGLGLYFVILLFIFILYAFHICKHDIHSPTPLTPTANTDDHFIRLTQGLPDDVLATFPTFQCSEAMKTHKVNTHGSGCSICLTDYKPNDVLRTLPECGHLFHVSCVDTWLKAHPTCPMCRNSLKFNVVYVS